MSEAMPTPPESTWEEKITPGRFAGKVAIVTGAGSGIGLATALRIAKEGGRVIAADVSQPRLDALVAANPDLDIVPVFGDISKQEDVDRIVDTPRPSTPSSASPRAARSCTRTPASG